MAKRISVVLSQTQSHHPKKRAMEEAIVGSLLGERGIDVTIVPHLIDLKPDGSGMICLNGIPGDMIICSWLFPRAARWTLDRNGIRGREGVTTIKAAGETDDDDDLAEELENDASENNDLQDDGPARVIESRKVPNRTIWCLDLRTHDSAEPYLEEIRRIAMEASMETVQLLDWIQGSPKPEQLDRYLNGSEKPQAEPEVIEEDVPRRWYPVIDFSRCTNCLECIDFCLFGVYGIDRAETILVEQPDNCRKGCPACSRVCPENAIIFPQHKSPTIAGSPEVGGPMKIDLSQLFGAPDLGTNGASEAVDVAVRERDEQLLLAGRDSVGAEIGLAKRQEKQPAANAPADDLDQLIDDFDALDL